MVKCREIAEKSYFKIKKLMKRINNEKPYKINWLAIKRELSFKLQHIGSERRTEHHKKSNLTDWISSDIAQRQNSNLKIVREELDANRLFSEFCRATSNAQLKRSALRLHHDSPF